MNSRANSIVDREELHQSLRQPTPADEKRLAAQGGGLKKLIILNQTVGPTTIDIANLFATSGTQVELYAGSIHPTTAELNSAVHWHACPHYSRTSTFRRAASWCSYTAVVFAQLLCRRSKGSEILAVSNPPLNLLTCRLLKLLRGIHYHLLIFDVYPDALVHYGYAEHQGLLIRILRWLNRRCIQSADAVFTISDRLRESLLKYAGKDQCVQVIHNWADTESIRPIPKTQNRFLAEHHLSDHQIVLYSGNFGKTHDLDTLLDAARLLRSRAKIRFVLIGEGEQLPEIQRRVRDDQLTNVTLLPLQPPSMFPHSIACGDVSIVTLDPAAAAVSVPSKTYYLMAAGSPILAIAAAESELADLVAEHQMGLRVQPGQYQDLADAIVRLLADDTTRENFAKNARAASAQYTPKNAQLFQRKLLEKRS